MLKWPLTTLDQFEPSAPGTLVVSVEKIDRNNRPRSDTLVSLEWPHAVIDDSHDEV